MRTSTILILATVACTSCGESASREAVVEQQTGPAWEWVPPAGPPYAEPPIPGASVPACEPTCEDGVFRCLAPCEDDTEPCPPVSLYTVPCVTGCFVAPGAPFPHGGCNPPACGARALGSASCSGDRRRVEACVLNTSSSTVLEDGSEVPSGQPLGAVIAAVETCDPGFECLDRILESTDAATGQPDLAHLVGCVPEARCPIGDGAFLLPGDVRCVDGQRQQCPPTVTDASQGPVPAGACSCSGARELLRCAGGGEVCGGRCDGTADCGDGSDEQDCPCHGFLCGSGECVTPAQRCNGSADCSDGSDETCEAPPDCPPTGCSAQACSPFFDFQCGSGECVSLLGVCDGVAQCGDASDETGPACDVCKGRFQCGTGECVAWAAVCDGLPHCPNAEDEGTDLCTGFPGLPPLPPPDDGDGVHCDPPDAGVDAGPDAPADGGGYEPDAYDPPYDAAYDAPYDAGHDAPYDAAHDATTPDGGSSTCGDGLLDPGEQCDGAAAATCFDLGYLGGGALSCTSSCTYDTSGCEIAYCGDGAASGMEACDAGDLRGMTCGDFGYTGGALACSASCAFDTSGCDAGADAGVDAPADGGIGPLTDAAGDGGDGGIEPPPDADAGLPDAALDAGSAGGGCGDGAIDGDEACDGAELEGTTCESLGYLGGGALACDAACAFDTAGCLTELCGDALCDGGEGCASCPGDCGACPDDGGGSDDGDGSDGSDGGDGGGYCGDGVVGLDEACDGANLLGQSCASLGYLGGGALSCFACTFDTAGCQTATCGDALCDADEGCAACPGDCGACPGPERRATPRCRHVRRRAEPRRRHARCSRRRECPARWRHRTPGGLAVIRSMTRVSIVLALAACTPQETAPPSQAPPRQRPDPRLRRPEVARMVALPAGARPLRDPGLDRADRLALRFCLAGAGTLAAAGDRLRSHLAAHGWDAVRIVEMPDRPAWHAVHARTGDLRLAGSLGHARQRGCDRGEDVAVTLTVVAAR